MSVANQLSCLLLTCEFVWQIALLENLDESVDDNKGPVKAGGRRQDLAEVGGCRWHRKAAAGKAVFARDPTDFGLKKNKIYIEVMFAIAQESVRKMNLLIFMYMRTYDLPLVFQY